MPTRWIVVIALSTALAFAAEPSLQDQSAMQAALTRYFRAVNACNPAAARLETIEDYWTQRQSLPPGLATKLAGTACGQAQNPAEFAVLARTVTMINKDTAIADGFFRTAHFVPERAGRVHIVFVRQGSSWKIAAVRLAPVQFEAPNYAVPVSGSREETDAEGWATIDAGEMVDLGGNAVTPVWELDGGTFHAVRGKGRGRDIRTKHSFRNFELRFDWKVSPAANSGVKYRLFYLFSDPERGANATGYEYQIVDNDGDPGARQHPVERAGSLYNQLASGVTPRPVGEWNQGVLIVKGSHVEHWLNGQKAVELECESAAPEGPIVFQHHGGGAWLRNIRIRRLD
jgi:hypothetical protein